MLFLGDRLSAGLRISLLGVQAILVWMSHREEQEASVTRQLKLFALVLTLMADEAKGIGHKLMAAREHVSAVDNH